MHDILFFVQFLQRLFFCEKEWSMGEKNTIVIYRGGFCGKSGLDGKMKGKCPWIT